MSYYACHEGGDSYVTTIDAHAFKIELAPRQGGKTQRMLEWACRTGGTIVCITSQEAERLYDLAIDQGHNVKKGQFFSGHSTRPLWGASGSLAIDNADHWLQQMFNGRIDRISMTL